MIHERVAREVRRNVQVVRGLARAAIRPSRSRRLWVFGGFVGAAFGDNSAELFRFVRASRPDIDAIWVIDEACADARRAAAVGPTVHHTSVEAAALAAEAEVLVTSHGLHDVPGYASRAIRGVRVRVGHGLTAFKKTKAPTGRTSSSLARLYDVVPVASSFERDNKAQWGLQHQQLPICGVCRFDGLLRASTVAPAGRRLLYMPTWRDWLSQGARAAQDVSVAAMADFVSSPRLAQLLDDNDLHLDLYAHRLFGDAARQALAQRTTSTRVRCAERSEDVQALLAGARALITDYSSVTWDMLYIDRPVVFFAPDVDAYERSRGAYFDLRADLPGPSARTVEQAVDLVEQLVHTDFALTAQARRWQERAFQWRDGDNCARVVEAIEAAVAGRR